MDSTGHGLRAGIIKVFTNDNVIHSIAVKIARISNCISKLARATGAIDRVKGNAGPTREASYISIRLIRACVRYRADSYVVRTIAVQVAHVR
jgi:hypothetical protein